MAHGLRKLTAAANTLQAWEDFNKLACKAVDLGLEDYEITKYTPVPQAGWRTIDKCIAGLRAEIAKREQAQR
jgi:hypothetical protein